MVSMAEVIFPKILVIQLFHHVLLQQANVAPNQKKHSDMLRKNITSQCFNQLQH